MKLPYISKVFNHRELERAPYYPTRFNFGIIPTMIGCFVGMLLGTIVFLSYISKMMGW